MRHAILIPFVFSLLVTPAMADVTSGGRTIDCFCTDKGGNRIELGEFVCLNVNGRMFTAQCQMSLNVPMWRETQDGCAIGQTQPTLLDRLQLLQPT